MYQKAIVVYFDILGFKRSVYKSLSNSKEFKKLKDLFRIINKEKRKHKNKVTSKKVIFTSDSILYIYLIKNNDLPSIIWDIAYIQAKIIDSRYLIRGGISFGDVYLIDDNAFGPAINEAVALEKTAEGWPMIKFSHQFFLNYLENSKNMNFFHPGGIEDDIDDANSYLKRDLDSVWISHIQNDENDIMIPNEQTETVLKELIDEYKNNSDEKISSKYIWLEQTYFKN